MGIVEALFAYEAIRGCVYCIVFPTLSPIS